MKVRTAIYAGFQILTIGRAKWPECDQRTRELWRMSLFLGNREHDAPRSALAAQAEELTASSREIERYP